LLKNVVSDVRIKLAKNESINRAAIFETFGQICRHTDRQADTDRHKQMDRQTMTNVYR